MLGEPGIIAGQSVSVVSNLCQARLLVALALARDGLTHDQLAERLWEDDERPDDPTASIRTYANRLRNHLRDDDGQVVVTKPGGYAHDNDRVGLDSAGFESLVADEAEILDPAERADVLERALSLWRGDAFGSLCGLTWRDQLRRVSPG